MRQENGHIMLLIWLHDQFIEDCNAFYFILLSVAIRESCIFYFSHNIYRDLKLMECKNTVTAMHSGLWFSFIWIGPPPWLQQKTGRNYAWSKNTNLTFLCSSSSLLHSLIQECCQQCMLQSTQFYIHLLNGLHPINKNVINFLVHCLFKFSLNK